MYQPPSSLLPRIKWKWENLEQKLTNQNCRVCVSQQLNCFCLQFAKMNLEFHVNILFILRIHAAQNFKINTETPCVSPRTTHYIMPATTISVCKGSL